MWKCGNATSAHAIAFWLLWPLAAAWQFDPRSEIEALRDWCMNTPSPFKAFDTIDNNIVQRGFAMATCYMQMIRADNFGRHWSGASLICAMHPALPPGVVGHLAIVPAAWVAQRIIAATNTTSTAGGCAWVGLRHGTPPSGRPTGWYHEPHYDAELQRWQLAAGDVPTPWENGQPAVTYAGCLQVSTERLRSYGDGGRQWICEYHHESAPPHRFYKMAGGAAGRRPVQAALIAEHVVGGLGVAAGCGALCAADRLCAGFAVDQRSHRCATAYEVDTEGATEAAHGYELYEKVHKAP